TMSTLLGRVFFRGRLAWRGRTSTAGNEGVAHGLAATRMVNRTAGVRFAITVGWGRRRRRVLLDSRR
ncbi:MAG: hypothetical protein ACXVRW_17100, partial [Solirubrobacteraceae bacterium]